MAQTEPLPQPPPLDGDAVKQQAGAAAQNLVDQVQDTAGQATAQARETALSLLNNQKGYVTANLDALADALRQASAQLRGSEGGALFAGYLDTAATRVQGVSGHLDAHEVSDLYADLESYARRQPAVFLGGMFAAGALVARFLRSTGGGAGDTGAPTRSQAAPPAPPAPATHGMTQPIPPASPMHRDQPDRLGAAYRNDPPLPPDLPPAPVGLPGPGGPTSPRP